MRHTADTRMRKPEGFALCRLNCLYPRMILSRHGGVRLWAVSSRMQRVQKDENLTAMH